MIKNTNKIISVVGKATYNAFAKHISAKTSTAIGYADAIMKCNVNDVWNYIESNDEISRGDFELAGIEAIENEWAKLMMHDVSYYYDDVECSHFLSRKV